MFNLRTPTRAIHEDLVWLRGNYELIRAGDDIFPGAILYGLSRAISLPCIKNIQGIQLVALAFQVKRSLKFWKVLGDQAVERSLGNGLVRG